MLEQLVNTKFTKKYLLVALIMLLLTMHAVPDVGNNYISDAIENNIAAPGTNEKINDIPISESVETVDIIEETNSSITSLSTFESNTYDQIWQGESIKVDYASKNNTVKSLNYSFKENFEYLLQWGSSGVGNGEFNIPFGIAVDSTGDVYVADTNNDRVQKFDVAGTYITQWGSLGTADGQFDAPQGIAVDSTGNVYVADSYNDRVQKFDSTGTFISKFGSAGTGNGEFKFPKDIAVDSTGDVYVADVTNDRVQKFDSVGTYITQWGSSGSGDGEFNYLSGIAVDSTDNVYVTDANINRVQKFDSTGTFISKFGSAGTGDGQFNYPQGIVIDSTGNIYVSDASNRRIQKFDSTGTFISKFGSAGTGNGEFNFLTGIVIDSIGDVYVIDAGNHRIQKFWLVTTNILTDGMLPNKIDDNDLILNNIKTEDTISEEVNIGFTYYDMTSPNSVGIVFSWETKRSAIYTPIFSDEQLTLDLSDEAIYSSDELKVYFIFSYSSAGFEATIITFDTGLNQYISNSVISSVSYFDEFDNSIIKIDYVWAESQSSTADLRPDCRYGDDVTQGICILKIEVYDYRIPLKVYTSLDKNLTSVSPSANWQWDNVNKYWLIRNTLPVIYTLIFNFGDGWGIPAQQKKIVALNDVSSDYLDSPSFESGSNEDLTNDATNSFDSLSLNTSIVNKGSFSLELIASGLSEIYLSDSQTDYGEYYVSFSYYIESAPGSLRFYHSSTTNYDDLDLTINRWQTHFTFISFTDATTFLFKLYSSSTSRIYIDNFFIGKASAKAVNIGYQQTEFSATFHSWDGYQNPVLSSEEVEWQLRDRTADEEIISKTLTTNSLGIASYIFQGTLEQKEYENRWWSYDSWFGNIEEITESTDRWGTSTLSSNSISGDYSISFTSSTITYTPSSNYDFSNIDSYAVSVHVDTAWSSNMIHYVMTDWSNAILYTETNDYSANTWYDVKQSFSDFTDAGSFDQSDVDFLYFNFGSGTRTFLLDGLHFIQAQKSYFTPTSVLSYSYQTLENGDQDYFDFESTDENVIDVGDGDYSSTNNGSLAWVASGSLAYAKFGFSSLVVDTSFYTHLQIRIKANEDFILNTAGFQLAEIKTTSTIMSSFDGTYGLTTDWQIFEIDLSSDSDWTGTVNAFYLTVYNYHTGTPFNGDETMLIDFVSLIHKQHNNGYAWEMNEPEMNKWDWVRNFATTVETSGGISTFTLTGSGSDSVWGVDNRYEIDGMLSTMTHLEFFAKSNDAGLTLQLLRDTGTWATFTDAIVIDTTWTKYVIELNSYFYTYVDDTSFIFALGGSLSIGDYIQFDYIRFVDNSQAVNLYETDNSFVFSSTNDTSYYYAEQDGFSLGIFQDLEYISKNMSVGEHNFSYTHIYDSSIDENLLQLASTWYSYDYVIEDPEDELTIEYFYRDINDFTFSITFGSNWANQTGNVYSNGSLIGSLSEDITTVFDRLFIYDTYYNITVTIGNYIYQFGYYNSPETIILEDNLLIYSTDFQYDASGYIYFDWLSNWENTTVTIFDNSTSLGSGPESSIAVQFDQSYGLHNITLYVNVSSTNYYIFYTSFTLIEPVGEMQTILIFLYDLSGQRLYQSPWDLYYNSSILESYSIILPIETFNTSLIEFKDLFGIPYPGTLINKTESISGYKVYQFQLQAYKVSLFNEQTDSDAILTLKQGDTWANYTLAPGEQRSIWVANTTIEFWAYTTTLDETGLQNSTMVAVGSDIRLVSENISFGLSQSVRALINNEDITLNEYTQSVAAEKYAIYYVGDFYGIPVDIKITLGQLWGTIIIGLITILIGIIRIFIQKNVEVKLDQIYDVKSSRYVSKKRYKLKDKTEWEFALSDTMKAAIIIILAIALISTLAI